MVSVPALSSSAFSHAFLLHKNYDACFIKDHEILLVNLPPSWFA
jgi:hypothetical protein